MPQIDTQIIHKQVEFLDRLRKTNYENVLPFSPVPDLNRILKRVKRKRQEKLNQIKLEKLKKVQLPNNNQQIEKTGNRNDLFEPNTIKLNPKCDKGIKRDYICENPYTERSENVFSELLRIKEAPSLNYKHDKQEDPQIIQCLKHEELKTLDFNTLLMKVKRERKKKQFEEKWKRFTQTKSECQRSHDKINHKLSNEIISCKLSDLNSELIDQGDSCHETKELEEDGSFCECPSPKYKYENSESCKDDFSRSHNSIYPYTTNENMDDRGSEVLEEDSKISHENLCKEEESEDHEKVLLRAWDSE